MKPDAMDEAALEVHAGGLPSLGGVAIGPFLRAAAAGVPDGMAIVELGSWLGAGTAQLALGLRERAVPPPIHVYDKFKATGGEVGKASRFGLTLKRGQNTLPIARGHLAPFGADVRFHRGSLWDAAWPGGAIGLHIDDAAKTRDIFLHVLRTFGTFWVAGVTVVVLMDVDYWRTLPEGPRASRFRAQQNFLDAHSASFAPIEEFRAGDTPARAFRYVAPIDFAALPVTARRPSIAKQIGRALARS